MRGIFLGLILTLGACALPVTYVPVVPQHETRGGDIRVHVPHSHDQRKENGDGAAACAQYGRVARPGRDHGDNGRDYECVPAGDVGQH